MSFSGIGPTREYTEVTMFEEVTFCYRVAHLRAEAAQADLRVQEALDSFSMCSARWLFGVQGSELLRNKQIL